MNLLKGLKPNTIESLANLWTNKDFKELVKVLRINQDNLGKMCLLRRTDKNNWEEIRELQDTASAYSLIIKTVEDAYRKENKLKEKKNNANQ